MLELLGVSKRYGDKTVLQPTTLSVPAGKTCVLIGPSGCGKSTLLRLIVGLIEPDAGSVRIGDEPLTRHNLQRQRQALGYVIQEGGLFPHLTARDNVTLMARHLRWPAARISERVADLADLVQLPADALERYPAQLSGGQRQRVGLMRALMLDPKLLLLDEPLGALDPLVRFDLQQDLARIFKRLHKTVVLVTHDLAEAAYFADEIVLLEEGRVLQRGTVADLFQRPASTQVTRFINAQRPLLPTVNGEGKT